jgi:hypothetical protein
MYMSPESQSVFALIIVAVAAAWLIFRAVMKRKNPGCGGDCGCPTEKLKR